jgi:serine phosphatase RsbU (regulator of sigma subunit)
MFFAVLDEEGNLDFINAGHPSPLLLRRGLPEEAFTEGSCPVGLVPEAEYTSVRVKLEPGDTLILFSDGVTEAMDPDDQLFGVPRLKKVVTGLPECPLDQIQKCVLEAVENFARGAHQADDLTLLIVRYRAAAAAARRDTDVPADASSSAASSAASAAGAPASSASA